MIHIIPATLNWVPPQILRALAWALLHFLWQGTGLAALAAAAMALVKRTSVRYAIAVGVLLVMLLAPLATFSYYSLQTSSAKASQIAPIARVIEVGALSASGAPRLLSNLPAEAPSGDALPLLVELWLIGVAFFSLRSAGGFVLLDRVRRKQSSVVSERVLETCYALQDQLGIRRAVQFCECAWLQAPAVIGWFRPIVFLPIIAVTGLSEEQLRLVIAHELAHIRRYDAFVNVFQICGETLLFYHPAVWWLNRQIRAEREHCCDEMAVATCGNAVEYARALTLMEEWRSAPTLAMAANRGPLTERVVRVLGLKTLGAGMRSIGITGSLICLSAALLAGKALLGIAHPPVAHATAQAAAEPSASPEAAKKAESKPSAAHPQAAPQATPRAEGSRSSYIDGMKSVGLTDLSIDTLIALKTQDVTPEYVRGLQEQGLHPDADKLIAMRVQDVTPEYVREWREAGVTPNIDQLISLKVQGADAAFYRGMKEAGLNPDIDRLVSLKVQGATPEYVRALKSAGLSLNADQVISMRVQDVTPEYVKAVHELGFNPSADELISMRVQDVTPEYVRAIQALGIKPSANELISMKVQGVTPEYIKALQSAGLNVGIDQIISAKVQDVTSEFIEQARKHGFKDLTLDKLIRLRQLGILDTPKADL
jgi:beta-lactamase regulating signal transducer with metallopeptidase domain